MSKRVKTLPRGQRRNEVAAGQLTLMDIIPTFSPTVHFKGNRSKWLPKGRELTLDELVASHGDNCPCVICMNYRKDNNLPLVNVTRVGDR